MLHPIASPYPELFATYDELGAILAEWDRGESALSPDEFEESCADLVDRLILLGKAVDQYSEQRWTLKVARYIAGVTDGA